MKVRILPSAPEAALACQYLTSFLVNESLAVDAGCLGLNLSLNSAPSVRHIFLTHPHVDHVGTLPIFLENQLDVHEDSICVYGSESTLEAVQEHFFNPRVWIDYNWMQGSDPPWVEFHAVKPEEIVHVNGLRITAVPVHHTVPTYGYILEDGSSAVIFGADSGPTMRIWQLARPVRHVRAIFLECSFPNALADMAARSGHLTPRLLAEELPKLPPDAAVIAVHIKPRYRERVISELMELGQERIQIGEVGHEYTW